MNKIAVCTAFYEAARPFLADYLAGVGAASCGLEITLLIVNDGLAGATEVLSGAPGNCSVELVTVREKMTPVGVRRLMLAQAHRLGAEVLILADADDILYPKAIDLHLHALEVADFSYGDMALLDETGSELGRRLFENCGIPRQIRETKEIAARNFLGFSNTALRRHTLAPGRPSPPDTVSCADWWVFTMGIAAGWRGRRTAAPVAGYRLHGENTLGAGPPTTAAQARAQAKMLKAHLDSLTNLPSLKAQREALLPGFERLARAQDGEVEAALRNLAATPGVWFEHISKLLAEKADSL